VALTGHPVDLTALRDITGQGGLLLVAAGAYYLMPAALSVVPSGDPARVDREFGTLVHLLPPVEAAAPHTFRLPFQDYTLLEPIKASSTFLSLRSHHRVVRCNVAP
jgi:hypothetical protein